jgi:hypothetical protein
VRVLRLVKCCSSDDYAKYNFMKLSVARLGCVWVCALALATLSLDSPEYASATGALDPYQIFARVRHYWETQEYPEVIEYTVAIRVFERSGFKTERYYSGYDSSTSKVSMDVVSDYETAHPYYPHGINFGAMGAEATHTSAAVDFLGVPMLIPNFSFGLGSPRYAGTQTTVSSTELIRAIRADLHDPNPHPSPAPTAVPNTSLREIVEVSSSVRTYDISLVGIELVDDKPAYHLSLKPLHDPQRNRLRELWVDAGTYAPLRLVTALNFVSGPGTSMPWLITFEQNDGVTYIDRETTLAPTSFERHRYDSVVVVFEGVHAVKKFDYALSAFVPEHTFLLREP